uniref:Uncharacterized protein n=2 Tax=Bionectria ochroleuca TaxID=29856 RepID=A0A8H7N5B5_BIOOC
MQRHPASVDIFSASIYTYTGSPRPSTREGFDAPPPLTQSQSSSAVTTLSSSSANTTSSSTTVTTKESGLTAKDRKSSFSRKAAAPFSGSRRRGSSAGGTTTSNAFVTDAAAPPALPDYALAAAAKVITRDRDHDYHITSPTSPDNSVKMLSRSTTTSSTAAQMTPPFPPPTPSSSGNGGAFWQPSDSSVLFQQITDLAHKRITTLDYLRKAHEGRVYWFNTYLFDKSDLNRMPCFDNRKLARKATNYLLLGISLPVVVDLNSSTPIELLRSLSTLLSEFDSFQQLRSESSTAAITRARLPNMFRRPGGKSRRSTSATDTLEDAFSAAGSVNSAGANGDGGMASSAPSVINFAASESDLLPGEEYVHLLTPSLPFEPDYFETFATLCDTLIDCYSRLLALIPTARECSAAVAELFTKADARVRKIIVQGIIKEFEDSSRANVRSEVGNVGKVVLSGLMG